MKTMHLIVTGKVQGVCFREFTQKKAVSLGVTGYVKNLSDGSVEVKAQGNGDELKELLAFCRVGPSEADVEDVQVNWVDEAACKEFSFGY